MVRNNKNIINENYNQRDIFTENIEGMNTFEETQEQFTSSSFLDGIVVDVIHEENKENLRKSKADLKEVRKILTSLTVMIANQADQIKYQEYMGIERKLPKEVFHQALGFFIEDFEYNKAIFGEHLYNKDLGLLNDNNNPQFAGRFIYPVMGFNNEVLGFIGYDKFHNIKYLLSKTAGFGKSNMFYGMHMMRWIYSCGYIVVVEGIVECLWLWSKGIPAISLNGNHLTEFVKRILLRFDYNVIFIPDNDETGERAIQYWVKGVPKASQIKLTNQKDIDEWRLYNDEKILFRAIDEIKESMLIKIPKKILI